MVTNQDLALDNDATYGQLIDERDRLAYNESIAKQEIATAEDAERKIVGGALEEEKKTSTTSTDIQSSAPADPKSAEKDVAVEAVGQTSAWIQVLQTGAAITSESRTNDSNAADIAKGKKAGLVSADAQSIQDITKQMKQPAMSGAFFSAKDGQVGFSEVSKLTKDMPQAHAKSQIQAKVAETKGTLQNVVKHSYGIQAANKEAVAEIDHRLATTPNAAAAPSVLGLSGPAMSLAGGPKPPTHMTDEETVV